MSEAKGFAQGAQKGLDLAIPLILQKRRLDFAEDKFNTQMGMKRLELEDEAEQTKDKMEADFLSETISSALERGDVDTATNAMQNLQSKFGFGFDVPEDLPGETPDDLEELAIQGMTPEQALNVLQEKWRKTSKPKDMTTERRLTAEKVLGAESIILKDPHDPNVTPHIDYFNRYARKPYVWTMTEGKVVDWGRDIKPKAEKIKLPKHNGRQVYASDIYENMIEYDKTFEEVLREIGAIE